MSRKRRNHSPEFKSKVALAAVKGDETLSQLASRFNINANLIVKWKKQLLDNSAEVFLNNENEPSLVVDKLEHGISTGSIGVYGPKNGSAWFCPMSNARSQLVLLRLMSPSLCGRETFIHGMTTQWGVFLYCFLSSFASMFLGITFHNAKKLSLLMCARVFV